MNHEDHASLEGKVALVTGGSRGLGREMVQAFARAGADVVIVSRSQDSCDELAALVQRETGRRAYPRAAHVGHWDALDGLGRTGRPDGLAPGCPAEHPVVRRHAGLIPRSAGRAVADHW